MPGRWSITFFNRPISDVLWIPVSNRFTPFYRIASELGFLFFCISYAPTEKITQKVPVQRKQRSQQGAAGFSRTLSAAFSFL
jgi:hypothetical protein